MAKKSISPIDIYKLLPQTNCKECSEDNCMAFATKLVNRESSLEDCPPLIQEKYKESYKKIWDLLKPPMKEITIGVGERAVKLGGQLVMYRHEFTYYNKTPIAIDVTDEMSKEELIKRVKAVEDFTYQYIGKDLKLNLIAVRSTSNDANKFSSAVKTAVENTSLPIILCSFNPEVLEAGLMAAQGKRPLLYAATKDNWTETGKLALMYDTPLAVFAPNNLDLLKSLAKTLTEYGVEDLVLDPGTYPEEGIADTINNFTMLRRAICKEEDETIGFPLIGIPLITWTKNEEADVARWKEAYTASVLMARFADLLIMHSFDGWVLLPTVIFRDNLYTDPRKPVAVKSELVTIGNPDKSSPVLLTTNFALTYYTVEADIKSADVSCYLIVVNTEGISVESAVAGRKLTADKVSEAIKDFNVSGKVEHKKIIIPGRAARLSGEIEEVSGWDVMVGPLDSSGIAKFLSEKWPPKKA